MSHTELTALDAAGQAVQSIQIQNAFRGAMHVWMTMAKELSLSPVVVFDPTTAHQVLDVWKVPDAPTYLQITMLSTFDNMLVRRSELVEVAQAFQEFSRMHAPGSLLEQAAALEELSHLEQIHAVGWCHTSVIDNPWRPLDPTGGEYRPFDFATDTHWFLFDVLREFNSEDLDAAAGDSAGVNLG
ncbi:hypothetical protein ACFFLM_08725 [Deinococcus oregonensis]|uniref:Uncharacterized protein n=1 Tax=Deinococcus oregonensis TaxID=1805970 RepID=A0ABV6AX07_9DEIO